MVRVAKYARRPNKTVGIFCANVRAEQRHLYLELYTAAQTNSFLLSDQKKIRGKRGGEREKRRPCSDKIKNEREKFIKKGNNFINCIRSKNKKAAVLFASTSL